jgi:hypothetical protein
MADMESRFFLAGCPRSGTTLLQSLVASHPLITSFPESHFFSRVQAKWRWLRALGIASSDARSHLVSYFKEMGHEDVLQEWSWGTVSIRAHVEAFVRGLDAVARRREVPIWLEKTPQHLHYVDDIRQYVPGASFIHIVRRGEDVVASMYEVTHQHPDAWEGARDLETCLKRWAGDIDLTLQYSRLPAHVVVHYDDLVVRTEPTLRRVCRHVGVEYDAKMVEEYENMARRVRTEQEDWKERNTDEIALSTGKFERIFEAEERANVKERVRSRNKKIEAFRE